MSTEVNTFVTSDACLAVTTISPIVRVVSFFAVEGPSAWAPEATSAKLSAPTVLEANQKAFRVFICHPLIYLGQPKIYLIFMETSCAVRRGKFGRSRSFGPQFVL